MIQQCSQSLGVAHVLRPTSTTTQRRPHRRMLGVILLLAALAWSLPALADRCYVNTAATGQDDGSTWSDAYTYLSVAMTDISCTEFWVAAGVYQPLYAGQSSTFRVRSGQALYGGFAGGETALSQRQPGINITVLSGDMGNNDSNTDGNGIDEGYGDIVGTNALHVITLDGTSSDITASTRLDGFIITGGSASGTGAADKDFGGGLFCDGRGGGHVCSPTIANATFSGNFADDSGGGAYFAGGTPTNISGSGGVASPTLVNVTFRGNHATKNGGAVVFDGSSTGVSNPTLTNATFSDNSAGVNGGAIFNSALNYGSLSITLNNATFHGNSADTVGGAMMSVGLADFGDGVTVYNSIFWGNTASALPEIGTDATSLNTTVIYFSVVQDAYGVVGWNPSLGYDGGGNVDADPKLGALAYHGGSSMTLLPGAGSAAIDAGWSSHCAADDQRGIARPQGSDCDIGAVEVRQAQLAVTATVGGSVSAQALPLAQAGGISACAASGGACSATYIAEGASAVALDLTPEPGYAIGSASGCGGSLSGVTFTTGVLSANCTVSVSFDSVNASVSASSSGHGAITPASQLVAPGGSASFTLTPDAHYHVLQVNGDTCTPTHASGDYVNWTAANITADCVVTADFIIYNYTVAASAGVGGSITPATQTVDYDGTASFTVTPIAGYQVVAVTGDTCTPVHGAGAAWTASNITGFCAVSATFAVPSHHVGGSVSGLVSGNLLRLDMNGGALLDVTANGPFQFPATVDFGASYVVSVGTQPTPTVQTCAVSNGSGSMPDADVSNVQITCAAAPSLALSVSDDSDYARYGDVQDYQITLTNSGNAPAINVVVGVTPSADISAVFDTSSTATWQCTSLSGPGTTCTGGGAGLFSDTVMLAAGGSVTWIASMPVKVDSGAPAAIVTVHVAGALDQVDTDTLVLFRDGFDVADGDGAQAVTSPTDMASTVLSGDGSEVVELTPPQRDGIETLRTIRHGEQRLRLQRLNVAGNSFVRLLTHDENGHENATAWAQAKTGAPLVLGSVVGHEGQRLWLLEGAARSLAIPIIDTPY